MAQVIEVSFVHPATGEVLHDAFTQADLCHHRKFLSFGRGLIFVPLTRRSIAKIHQFVNEFIAIPGYSVKIR